MNIYQLFLEKVKQYSGYTCPFCQKKLRLNYSHEYEQKKMGDLACINCPKMYKLNFFIYLEKYLQIREVFHLTQEKHFTIINMNGIDIRTGEETPYKLKIISNSLSNMIERTSFGLFLYQPQKTQDIINLISLLT